jgi:putative ABC transport system permease protein
MPDWKQEIEERLADLRLSPAREAEIVEELSGHLDDRYEDLLATGKKPDEASRIVRREILASRMLSQELARIERSVPSETVVFGAGQRINMIADLRQDVRYGFRSLRKNPAFTVVAVVTLALGIGANTAIFSLVNGILLRPLTYPEPDRLVTFLQSYPERGLSRWPLSQESFATVRDQNDVFQDIAAYATTGLNLSQSGEPVQLLASRVTAGFFKVRGMKPVIGREFRAEEDTPGRNNVCILSYGLWQHRFGGSPDVIGKTLMLDDSTIEVVGVMPSTFPWQSTEIWVPVGLNPQRHAPFFLRGIARLKPGVTIAEAEADTSAIFWNLVARWPDPPQPGSGVKMVVKPLKETFVGSTEKPLFVLLGAVGFVLLIACANIANLLLARAAGRTREIALRFAMGATRHRVVRQLLTESVMLALLGGAVGMLLAWLGLRMLDKLPVQNISRISEVSLSGTVMAFTVAVAVATGLLFGIAPALRVYRIGMDAGLREGPRGSGTGPTRRMNRVLVAAQLALSLVLLVGAGLLLRSFRHLIAAHPGFQTDNVLTMRLSLPLKTDPQKAVQVYQGLLDRVCGVTGVRAAGIVNELPFTGDTTSDGYIIEGEAPQPGGVQPQIQIRDVTPGYFESMGIPLTQGRDFLQTDREGSQLVAIIDETIARSHWPAGDSIGKRLRLTGDPPWYTIVGVVGGIKDNSMAEQFEPHMYVPLAQSPDQIVHLAVRADHTALTASTVRQVIGEMEPNLPISDVRTMKDRIAETLNSERLINLLLVGFALLALLLAAVGIYGVLSVFVASRTTEFGIRLALGAQSAGLVRSVLGEGLLLVVSGIAVGIAGALALTHTVASLLFDVSATDPVIFCSVPLLLAVVAMLACYLPARRAAAVDPMCALRYE